MPGYMFPHGKKPYFQGYTSPPSILIFDHDTIHPHDLPLRDTDREFTRGRPELSSCLLPSYLSRWVLPPGPSAMPDVWADLRSKKLLRLLPGADGFVTWCQAKLAFVDKVSLAVREAQELFIEDHEDDPANGEDTTFLVVLDVRSTPRALDF